jgi:hypothetical protein
MGGKGRPGLHMICLKRLAGARIGKPINVLSGKANEA